MPELRDKLFDLARHMKGVPEPAGLTAEQLRVAWLEPAGDLAACAAELLGGAGPGARLAVLPQGPQTIPYVAAA